MIKSKSLLVSENIIRDAETNSISIINVVEEIHTPGFPVVFPKLSIFNLLERSRDDPETITFSLSVQVNEKVLVSQSIDIDFEGKRFTRSIGILGTIPIEEPGVLRIAIFYPEDVLLDDCVIEVIMIG